jgi:hypothetical protein
MSLQQRGQPQPGGGSGASWAQRSRTAEPASEAQHQENEQHQVELALRKHEQTTEATQRAARVGMLLKIKYPSTLHAQLIQLRHLAVQDMHVYGPCLQATGLNVVDFAW